eukprot:TRINITY_DN7679_c0_g1_i1.p1 TRINITY_DN7679_c0_g1~~TRINITY_DN7679_c0_g1_i1.p1  ORF type:complete len:533 (-),score=92.64 TRINITY_DN7679_c0_g1_i1:54-1631(-)
MGASGSRYADGGHYATYREDILSGITPQAESLSLESIYSQYYFDHGRETSTEVVHPLFSTAVTLPSGNRYHPSEPQYFMSLGLQSIYDGETDWRPPMSLVFFVDTSGSMSKEFSSQKHHFNRLSVVRENLVYILDNFMLPKDQVTIITTYEEHTEVLLDQQEWSSVNKSLLFTSIRDLIGVGASKLLPAMLDWVNKRKVKEISLEDYSQSLHPSKEYFPEEEQEMATRFLIFSDDLCPDQVGFFGKISKAKYEKEWQQYTGITQTRRRVYGSQPIYTTFYGLGFGIPPTLVSALNSQVGNEFCTLLPLEDMRQRLDETFSNSLCPVASHVFIEMHSSPFIVIGSYGWSGENMLFRNKNAVELSRDDGQSIYYPTVFASPKKELKGIKGGIALLVLKKKMTLAGEPIPNKDVYSINMGMSYRDATTHKLVRKVYQVNFPNLEEVHRRGVSFYSSTAIEKAILLSQYYQVAKQVMGSGIGLSEIQAIRAFKSYFESVAIPLDPDLLQEVELWEKLRETIPESWCLVM